MLQQLCRFFLFRLCGWREVVNQQRPPKCVICVAPHTSNWDFIIGKAYYCSKGLQSNFLMKREWFVGPLGKLLRHTGGIPVERSHHTSLTDQLATWARQAPTFSLAVTPEGTRSLVKQWKRGFYFIALKANLPILLYGIDYKQRVIQCTKTIYPSGNVEEDMREIMEYYRNFHGKHPEKFSVEEISTTSL